jgi:hypothetical protein
MVDIDLIRGYIEQVDLSCNIHGHNWELIIEEMLLVRPKYNYQNANYEVNNKFQKIMRKLHDYEIRKKLQAKLKAEM